MYSRFSPAFVEASLRGEFRSGELMPCPRCGESDVTLQDLRKLRWVACGIAAGAAALALFGQMMSAQCVGLVAVGVAAGSFFSEASYVCRRCGHRWRLVDAVRWAKGIRHDMERSGVKRDL